MKNAAPTISLPVTPWFSVTKAGGRRAAQAVTLTGDRFQREAESREVIAKAICSSASWRRPPGPPHQRSANDCSLRAISCPGDFTAAPFAPGEDPASLWPGIAEALYRIAPRRTTRRPDQFRPVKDFAPGKWGEEALRRFSYRPMETEPNMVLNIDPPGAGYDDYLAALDAKYRRNARDQAKKLLNGGCSTERLEDLHAWGERAASNSTSPSIRMLLSGWSLCPAASCRLSAARPAMISGADVIRGLMNCSASSRRFRDGMLPWRTLSGLIAPQPSPACPFICGCSTPTIGDAIDWGCKRLSLGRTALDPKPPSARGRNR